MGLKRLGTGGIQWVERLEGSEWHWGTDVTGGDLFEARELYDAGHGIDRDRLIFVRFPEGHVYEPVRAEKGRYFGRPVFWDGAVWILTAEFSAGFVRILRWSPGEETAEETVRLPLDCARDMWNLMLCKSPLALVRQGRENRFQVIWPEQGDFGIDPEESLDSRDGDVLRFSRWYEDPDFRQEAVFRRYPDGEVLRRESGGLFTDPDGKTWLLD